MRRTRIACLAGSIYLAVLGWTAPAQASDEPAFDALVAWAAPLVRSGDLAGSLTIARGGDVVFQHAWGLADHATKAPHGPDSRFGVGSITKQLTAATVLQLAGEGQLQLEDPLERWFPEARGREITIEHLLGHRSGLPRDVPLGDSSDLREIAREILAQPAAFSAGERVEYSNSGYGMLAAVVEQVTGSPFEQVVSERLLKPLGLRSSGFRTGPAPIRPTPGYDPGFGPSRAQETPAIAPRRSLGASGLVTTSGDLVRWLGALHEARVAPAPWHRRMVEDQGGGRGFGTGIYTRSGRRVVGHDGVENGFVAFVELFPGDDLRVGFAGNIRTSAYELLETAIGRLVAGRDLPEIPAPARMQLEARIDPSIPGTYRVHPGLALVVEQTPEGMVLTGTGGYPTPLLHIEGDRWFYRALYAEVHFERTGPGQVPSALTWTSVQGRQFQVAREETPPEVR